MSFLENAQMLKGRLSQPLPVISPLDSVSNTSRRTKRSSQSNASSLSACAKAEAQEAALREHATVLKKKYALELQKAQIQSETEQSALDADIAAANAKVRVSRTKAGSIHRSEPMDGMNSYLEEQGKNVKESYLDPET